MTHRFITLFLMLPDPLLPLAQRNILVKEEHVPQGRGADPEIICFFK